MDNGCAERVKKTGQPERGKWLVKHENLEPGIFFITLCKIQLQYCHSFIKYRLIDEDKNKNTQADTDTTGDYTKRKITLLIGNVREMNNSFT